MTGVLLIDKPAGPTSHDVVARIRRTSRERRIGHTGTLDPNATGLLPLVLGPATRLASFLTGLDKSYEATIRLGYATETDDSDGAPIGPPAARLPEAAEVSRALRGFIGPLQQVPPAHSAKKVEGRRAYEWARRAQPKPLAPAAVTLRRLEVLEQHADRVRIEVDVSAGFYVRALARDLGERLGCGAHLAALVRTRTGPFRLEDAIPLAEAEALGEGVAARLVSPADALPHLPSASLNATGLKRVAHGNPVVPAHLAGGWLPTVDGPGAPPPVRLLDADGRLVALAQARGGALHPVVVLG
jgi:tRNA pseudouridine55 synthase